MINRIANFSFLELSIARHCVHNPGDLWSKQTPWKDCLIIVKFFDQFPDHSSHKAWEGILLPFGTSPCGLVLKTAIPTNFRRFKFDRFWHFVTMPLPLCVGLRRSRRSNCFSVRPPLNFRMNRILNYICGPVCVCELLHTASYRLALLPAVLLKYRHLRIRVKSAHAFYALHSVAAERRSQRVSLNNVCRIQAFRAALGSSQHRAWAQKVFTWSLDLKMSEASSVLMWLLSLEVRNSRDTCRLFAKLFNLVPKFMFLNAFEPVKRGVLHNGER